MVGVEKRRVLRTRPRVPSGWETTHYFELLDDVIDPRDLAPIFERAGRLVGVGDWRPKFGRYEVTI